MGDKQILYESRFHNLNTLKCFSSHVTLPWLWSMFVCL